MTSTCWQASATPRIKPLLALLLAVLASYMWQKQYHALTKRPPSTTTFFQDTLPSEEEWISGQTAQAIAEIAAFAETQADPASSLKFHTHGHIFRWPGASRQTGLPWLRFEAGIRGGQSFEVKFIPGDYPWSPTAYVPFAREFAKHLTKKGPVSGEQHDAGVVQRLLTPEPDRLVQEDRRISAALTERPLDPGLHEEAALLLGSFALRDGMDEFSDNRRAMNLMAAHLAWSYAVRGRLEPCGVLAEGILLSLAGRQVDALATLASLQKLDATQIGLKTEDLDSWSRALRMRNTGDYRIFKGVAKPTLLERLEHLRALRLAMGSSGVSDLIGRADFGPSAEWCFIILANGFSVADGNMLIELMQKLEMVDAFSVCHAYRGLLMTEQGMIESLNDQPSQIVANAGPAHFSVLGWPMWAGLHQRRICEMMQKTQYFYQHLLGSPESGRDSQISFDTQFASLNFYPLVRPPDSKASRYPRHPEKFFEMTAQHPDWIPFSRWATPASGPRSEAEKAAFSRFCGWFNSKVLPGTAFDLADRVGDFGMDSLRPEQQVEVRKLAPYNCVTQTGHFLGTGGVSNAETDRAWSEMEEYDIGTLRRMAARSQSDPARYKELAKRICAMDPAYYLALGKYLVQQKDEEGAASAYQAGFEKAPDRVSVSNQMQWLVNYYADHGRTDEALRIAREGAEVYSWTGLHTMGCLMERLGRLDEAESYLKKLEERYSDHCELLLFYGRNKAKAPRYAEEIERLESEVFPGGLAQTSPADCTGPVSDGIRIKTLAPAGQSLRFQPGDVIVAIDGYRLHNLNQYYFLRDRTEDPHIRYIVRRGLGTIEISGVLPGRKLGGDVENVAPKD